MKKVLFLGVMLINILACSHVFASQAYFSKTKGLGVYNSSPTFPSIEAITASPLAGTYTIGIGGDYSTITAAVTDLKTNGVSAPVIFKLKADTYTEQINLTAAITGVSATNTITFTSESGDASTVIWQANTATTNYVVNLQGGAAANMIFKNITFQSTAVTTSANFRLLALTNALNMRFEGNRFIGKPLSTNPNNNTSAQLYMTNSSATTKNIYIVGNTFEGGYRSISAIGTTSAFFMDSTYIQNNTFTNTSGSIHSYYGKNMYISNNNSTTTYSNTTNAGEDIRIENKVGVHFILNNSVYASKGLRAVWVNNGGSNTSNNADKVLIANNFFYSNTVGSNDVHVVDLADSRNVEIVYNNICVSNVSGVTGTLKSNGVGIWDSYIDVIVKNNIIANYVGSGENYAIKTNKDKTYANTSRFVSDYNCVYTAGSVKPFNNNGTAFALYEWQINMGMDINSLVANPVFTSPYTTLIPTDTTALCSGGQVLASVSVDKNGKNRDAVMPSIGAIEYSRIPVDVAVLGIISPITSNLCALSTKTPVSVNIRNKGLSDCAINSITLTLKVNGVVKSTEKNKAVIASNEIFNFTFDTLVNLTCPQNQDTAFYNIEVSANLTNDAVVADNSNAVDIVSLHTATAPNVAPVSITYATKTTLAYTPTSPYVPVTWYDRNQTKIAQGNTYTTPILTANDTFYVSQRDFKPNAVKQIDYGTATNVSIGPVYYTTSNPNNYKYTRVHMLYKRDDIGGSGIIKSLAYELGGIASSPKAFDNQKIYMAHTSLSALVSPSSNSSMDYNNMKLVYTGSVTFDETWKTITLDSAFFYNGQDNLVIVWLNSDGNASASTTAPTFKYGTGGNGSYMSTNGGSSTISGTTNSTVAGNQINTKFGMDSSAALSCDGYIKQIPVTVALPTADELALDSIPTTIMCGNNNNLVKVRIQNIASTTYDASITPFKISFQTGSDSPITETVSTGIIPASGSYMYEFTTPAVPAGGTSTIKAWVSHINNTPMGSPNNDTVTSVLKAKHSGTITIASTSDVSKYFGSTNSELRSGGVGICGPVVVQFVDNATPYGNITLDSLTGVSATNTITLQGNAADSSQVTLGIVTLTSGANNFTIRNVTIKYTLSSSLVTVASAASNVKNIKFIGNYFINNYASNVSPVINVNNSATSNPGVSDWLFDGNYFDIKGKNNAVSDVAGIFRAEARGGFNYGVKNITFTNNVCKVPGYFIAANYVENLTIANNYIEQATTTTGTANRAIIDLGNDAKGNVKITNNIISNSQMGKCMLFKNSFKGLDAPVLIANNYIYGKTDTTAANMIEFTDTAANVNFVYNTLITNNSTATSGDFNVIKVNVSSASQPLTFKNNIIANYVNYAKAYAISTNDSTRLVSDYNCIYTAQTQGKAVKTGSAAKTFGEWNTLGSDAHSLNVNPQLPNFVSYPKTNIIPGNTSLKANGTALASVTTDYYNTLRAAQPTIGAMEFTHSSIDVAAIGLISPVSGCELGNETVKARIRNNSYGTIGSSNIQVKLFVDNVLKATEIVATPISKDSSYIHTFASPVDFSVLSGSQDFAVRFELALNGEELTANNTYQTTVTSSVPYNIQETEAICQGDSYNFGGRILTTSGIYHDTLTTTKGCDSILTLTLTVNPKYEISETQNICQGDSYTFRGRTLTTTGIYYDSLSTVKGCDSVFVLNLHVNPRYDFAVTQSICQGDSYSFGSRTLTTAGVYHDSLITTKGCDSIVALTLIVNPKYEISETQTICQGNSYAFGGRTLTTAGVYYDSLTTTKGCDSVLVLTLTVNPKYEISENQEICQGGSYTFRGNTYTTTGIYYDSLQTSKGCDSVFVLNLHVNPKYNISLTQDICQGDSYTFGSRTLTTAGVYRDSLTTAKGCDSIVTLTLHVNPKFEIPQTHAICQGDSYAFGGKTLTTAGIYYDSLKTAKGCDSVIVLTLTVNPSVAVNLGNDTIIDRNASLTLSVETGHTYLWSTGATTAQLTINRAMFNSDTVKVWVRVTNATNCVSTDTIQVIFKSGNGIGTLTTEDVFNIYPNPSNGIFNIEFTNAETRDIQIYDMTGKVIYHEKHNSQTVGIDLTQNRVSSGTYIINVDNKYQRKIIIK